MTRRTQPPGVAARAPSPADGPPAAAALADGELVLGPYRVLERLGAGGMGHVYKAEHLLMNRTVALKVLAGDLPGPGPDSGSGRGTTGDGRSPGTGPDPLARERFFQEIRAAARLSHPNIVTAYDAAEADGLLFLVMEYVEGTDLNRLVSTSGPLPVAAACEVVRQTALGLQYAHERGLVHRDVKPSNLMLTNDHGSQPAGFGLVKLLDFGLARLSGPAPAAEGSRWELAGTPDYMAPELGQDSRSADPRSDLYSLGCTFHYLLCGQAPFPGGAWTEKLIRHRLDEAPAVNALRPEVPATVAEIVRRLLAKVPEDRFPSAAALAIELRLVASEEGFLSQGGWCGPGSTSSVLGRGRADGHTPPPVKGLVWVARESAPGAGPEPSAPPTAEVVAPAAAPRDAKRRLSAAWFAAVASAVGAGLVGAWLVRNQAVSLPSHAEPPASVRTDAPSPAAPARANPFVVEPSGASYPTLAAAVSAAGDGATVTVHAGGPLVCDPLSWKGKALTLRAGPDVRPRLELRPSAPGQMWQPLLSTDRALTLDGLDLAGGKSGPGVEPVHLVFVEGASLRLNGCRLLAPGGSSLVVGRGPGRIDVEGCVFQAAALALCVEAGGEGTVLRMVNNTVEVTDSGGAALSVWGEDARRPSPVRIELEGNRVRAGRALSVASLPGGVEVRARGNELMVREAVVSFAGFPGPDGWRRATTWADHDNRYQTDGAWVRVEGRPAGPTGFAGWNALWAAPSVGTREPPAVRP